MGSHVEETARQYLGLRYRLLPYLYTQLKQSCQSGWPLMRPLYVDFPGDARVLDPGIAESEFLAGTAILVAPVLEPGVTKRFVYFPKGADWIDWWTGKHWAGGTEFEVAAPIDYLPFFIKAGTVLAGGCDALVTEELETGALYLSVFPGVPGEEIYGTVYLDDGNSLAYQEGQYSLLAMQGKASEKWVELELVRLEGSVEFPAFYKHPDVIIRLNLGETIRELNRITVGDTTITDSRLVEQRLEFSIGKPELPVRILVHFA